MKIGMPVLYEFNSVEENFILAQDLNLDFVELNLNFSYCREALENPEHLKSLINKYALEVTLHFYDEADFGTYTEVCDAYYELLSKYLKLGSIVGIKNLNVHIIDGPVVTISGVKNYIYEKEFPTYINRYVSYLKKVEVLCNTYNTNLVLENSKVVSYMTKTYQELINNNFTFTFDTGHDNNNNDILFNILKENPNMKFKELHIHDANRKTDHLCIGCGNVDIKFFKDLAIKNDAYVVLEVKSKDDLIKSVPLFKSI